MTRCILPSFAESVDANLATNEGPRFFLIGWKVGRARNGCRQQAVRVEVVALSERASPLQEAVSDVTSLFEI